MDPTMKQIEEVCKFLENEIGSTEKEELAMAVRSKEVDHYGDQLDQFARCVHTRPLEFAHSATSVHHTTGERNSKCARGFHY